MAPYRRAFVVTALRCCTAVGRALCERTDRGSVKFRSRRSLATFAVRYLASHTVLAHDKIIVKSGIRRIRRSSNQ